MYSEYSPRVSTMWPDLLPEAGREAGVANREVFHREPLVTVVRSDWLFRCRYEILLVHSLVLHILTALAHHLTSDMSHDVTI